MKLEIKTSEMTDFNSFERWIIDVKSVTRECDLRYFIISMTWAPANQRRNQECLELGPGGSLLSKILTLSLMDGGDFKAPRE